MAANSKKKFTNVENHFASLTKLRQSSLTDATRRKVFNEIGNMLQKSHSGKAVITTVNNRKDSSPIGKKFVQIVKMSGPGSNCSKSSKLPESTAASSSDFHLEENIVSPNVPNPPGEFSHNVKRAPRLTMKPPPSPSKDSAPSPVNKRPHCFQRASCGILVKPLQPFSCNIVQSYQVRKIEVPLKGNCNLTVCKKAIPHINAKNDVDLRYNKCLWMVTCYARHVFSYLLALETRTIPPKMISSSMNVDGQTRTKLVNWLSLAYLRLQLYQETFQLSVSIMDRYFRRGNFVSPEAMQLLAFCCLFLSVKYEEMIPVSFNDLLAFSKQSYTKKQVLSMEANILQALDFQIAQPVPIVFLRRFNVAAKCNRMQHTCGKYLTDLALLDEYLCTVRASKLAAASVFVATCFTKNEVNPEMWSSVLHHYTTYSFIEIRQIVSKLAITLISNLDKNRFIRTKYSSEDCHRVSKELPERGLLLKKLATLK